MNYKTIKLKNSIKISNSLPLVLIAGPCVIENENQTLRIAYELKKIAAKLKVPLIFKASYDKANRSSIESFRGPGLEEGLRILSLVKKKYNLPVLTDVHCRLDVKEVAKVVDIIQIPAFLCRQTDLITECAKTGLIVNIKKGQFLSPYGVNNIVKKVEHAGNKKIILTERGTSFGYNNLITDIRSLEIMKKTFYPVIFDATHSVQIPGGPEKSSGGEREFIKPLMKAAVSSGIAGVFVEVHSKPEKALSDGQNSLSLKELPEIMDIVLKIDKLIKKDDRHQT
ncbi:MAG: 3-deoxy-8-phosphooctulonate synthase [Elusimicrobia bacterium]|nr:3-deoxy-8-phosphooctulonate synthase [Candidatus Liberimonas magnetica]